eukprot:CAMPEP_0172389226 /NCGR_PEP_ID=MMETSP1061-20121228/6179_1 /TAXON_ID=37318 /ORGANISM="Pseudo-nitzschia pungens, Strain cf. pungens" /LENGTH=73 /DNA_ID=CAMNT_0013119335 /DNA_START=49 /DNA_END=270 /DNA_ORIENTATION=-
MTETKFDVGMTCDGCANAVKRILKKIEGVTEIVTDVDAKSVVVTHDDSVQPSLMLEKLQKWSAASGKSVALAA